MKTPRNTIKSCTYSLCPRGSLCPNFTPRPTKHSVTFLSCMYYPTFKNKDKTQ